MRNLKDEMEYLYEEVIRKNGVKLKNTGNIPVDKITSYGCDIYTPDEEYHITVSSYGYSTKLIRYPWSNTLTMVYYSAEDEEIILNPLLHGVTNHSNKNFTPSNWDVYMVASSKIESIIEKETNKNKIKHMFDVIKLVSFIFFVGEDYENHLKLVKPNYHEILKYMSISFNFDAIYSHHIYELREMLKTPLYKSLQEMDIEDYNNIYFEAKYLALNYKELAEELVSPYWIDSCELWALVPRFKREFFKGDFPEYSFEAEEYNEATEGSTTDDEDDVSI